MPVNGSTPRSLPYVAAVAPSTAKLRVVLADGHHFFREGLRGMLTAGGMIVIGEATDGAAAVALTRELEPDILVIDQQLPGTPCVETVRLIGTAVPDVAVVILAVSADEADALDALAAGACGYLLKGTGAEQLVGALRQAAGGHAVLPRRLLRAVAARALANGRPAPANGDETAFSARELEVILLIADGADNAAIGRELGISRHTVKQHVTNIFQKLGAKNRVEVAVLAVRRGLA